MLCSINHKDIAMKIILFLFCIVILSCTDSRQENENMETIPATVDSTPNNPAPIDPTMPGDTGKNTTDTTRPVR